MPVESMFAEMPDHFAWASPRIDESKFPVRTTYGRFDTPDQSEWRILEERTWHGKSSLIGDEAAVLIAFFEPAPKQPQNPKKEESTEKA